MVVVNCILACACGGDVEPLEGRELLKELEGRFLDADGK